MMYFYIHQFSLLGTLGNLICIGFDDATLRIWNVEGGGGNRVVQGESCI